MKRIRSTICALAAVAALTETTAAQSWESPTLFAPRAHDDIGLYLIKAEGTDDLGWVGIWRQSGNINLGVRGGLAPGHFDWLLGVELYGPLNVFGPDSPVLLSWLVSAGAMFGDLGDTDFTALRIPVGLSLGFNLGSRGLDLVPYVHPRVAFDLLSASRDNDEDTESEINFDVDVGADLILSDRFVIRSGVTLGDFTTFGVGVALRIPRRVAVR
jgi:hypothetical protein